MFSRIMNLNWKKMRPDIVQTRWTEALTLFNFSLQIIEHLRSHNSIFVLEHPAGASSWRLPAMQALLRAHDTHLAQFDQCRFGLRAPISHLPIRKPTRLLTNSIEVKGRFHNVRCQCTGGHCVIQGSEGKYKLSVWCQTYPDPLCEALVSAIAKELERQS